MPTTPTLNGQVLGQAEHATRAVLDRLLARAGVTFHDWVVLNFIATSGAAVGRDQLVARMTGALKIDDATVLATVDGLTTTRLLVADGARIGLTDAGQARYAEIRSTLDEVTARLYADLPADELATAGRVLTTLTDRANAELARTH